MAHRAARALALAAIAAAPAAQPALAASYSATASAMGTAAPPVTQGTQLQLVPVSAAATTVGAPAAGPLWPTGTTSAVAQATTNGGGSHLFATARVDLAAGSGNLSAEASAHSYFGDSFQLLVEAPFAGVQATLTVALAVSGAMVGDGSFSGGPGGWTASTRWSSELLMWTDNGGSRTLDIWQSAQVTPAGTTLFGSAPGVFMLSMPLVLGGDAVNVQMRSEVQARAAASAQAAGTLAHAVAVTNFGSTMAWGGIVSLVDAAGQPVPILSALSATSGLDYRNAYVSPVPEAPVTALWLTGLALLAGWARPRGRTAPAHPPA